MDKRAEGVQFLQSSARKENGWMTVSNLTEPANSLEAVLYSLYVFTLADAEETEVLPEQVFHVGSQLIEVRKQLGQLKLYVHK